MGEMKQVEVPLPMWVQISIGAAGKTFTETVVGKWLLEDGHLAPQLTSSRLRNAWRWGAKQESVWVAKWFEETPKVPDFPANPSSN